MTPNDRPPGEAATFRPDPDLIDNAEGNKRILASDRAAAQAYLDDEAQAAGDEVEARVRESINAVWDSGQPLGPVVVRAVIAAGYRSPAQVEAAKAEAWERGHFYCAAEQGDERCTNPYRGEHRG